MNENTPSKNGVVRYHSYVSEKCRVASIGRIRKQLRGLKFGVRELEE